MKRPVAVLLTLGLLAASATPTAVAQDCRYQCNQDFQACQRGCVDAQSYDNCVDKCRKYYDRCLESCT